MLVCRVPATGRGERYDERKEIETDDGCNAVKCKERNAPMGVLTGDEPPPPLPTLLTYQGGGRAWILAIIPERRAEEGGEWRRTGKEANDCWNSNLWSARAGSLSRETEFEICLPVGKRKNVRTRMGWCIDGPERGRGHSVETGVLGQCVLVLYRENQLHVWIRANRVICRDCFWESSDRECIRLFCACIWMRDTGSGSLLLGGGRYLHHGA